ncbi:hypothetical protein EsHS_00007290 [Epichloe bromicola]
MDRARLDAAYGDYCRQYHDNPIAMNVLQRFLDDRPVFQPPIDLLPVDEYERRLDLIAQIEKRLSSQKEFRINAATFSLFMIMPLSVLNDVASNAARTYDEMILKALGNLPQLIQSFTMGPIKAVPTPSKTAPRKTRLSQTGSGEAGSGEAAKLRKRPWLGGELDLATSPGHKRTHSEGSIVSRGSQATDSSSRVPRKQSEKAKCVQRDGSRCIVTKTDCPQVCHVLPFSWSGSDRGKIMAGLFTETMDQLLFAEFISDKEMGFAITTGELDKSWNMICLSASLHMWWGRCYFGLKYLGETPSDESKVTVKLEFRWLQQNQHTKAIHTLDQQQRRDFRDELLQTPHPAVAANVCPSNRPILSGQTVDVTLDEGDAPYFVKAIKIQWALVQLAAMSGGAEPTDEPLSRRDQMDPFSTQFVKPVNVAVAEWASQVPAGQAPPDETRPEDTDPCHGDETNPSSLREIPPKPANTLPRPSPRTSRPGIKSQNPPTTPPLTSTSPRRGPEQTKVQQEQRQQQSRQSRQSRQSTATNTKKENQPPR